MLLLADDEAREWRLLRVDVPCEDEEPILTADCPDCAQLQFRAAARAQDQSDSS